MRYQLRYIRAQQARASPGANVDDSRRERALQIFWCIVFLGIARPGETHVAHLAAAWLVLVFGVVHLSAPVPWLSGRASASHAEGRWFDPSRDHPV